MKIYLVISALLISISATSQSIIDCSGNNCAYDPALNVNGLNLSGFTTFSILGLADDLEIITPPLASPRNFRGQLTTNNPTGANVSIDVRSQKENSPASSFIFIADSIKNLNVNSSGFNGGIYSDSSRVCATKILDGSYGGVVQSAFQNRRSSNPLLPPNNCDETDLQSIQNSGALVCDNGGTVLSGPNITATRWTAKRECTTNAGRPMCVAKRVSVRCDLYADKNGGNCCDVSPSPDSSSEWQCNLLRCSASDSGWYRRYTYRMWESEYAEKVSGGVSNEFLCETLVGANSGGNQDTYYLRDKYYETTLDYYSTSADFLVYPPVGETVTTTQFSAGQCGSYSENPYQEFTSFSNWYTSGTDYVRMSGPGHKVQCSGASGDYSVGSPCYEALYARENPSVCTGVYTDYPIGNQCWEELKPNCTGVYTAYPVGSYCYNKLVNTCSGTYTNYPNGTYCYNKLKEATCSGDYTDFPVGSVCWTNNQPICTGNYSTYPQGSYCWQNLAPTCETGFVPEDPPSTENLFCDNYLSLYPENTNCSGNYTDYPAGSYCWKQLWPNCVGSYLAYNVNSYCYNKLAPTCTGVYSDYPEDSYCWDKLIPAQCTGVYTDYPQGSFCSEYLLPTCTGVYSDYPETNYCYYQLAPTCTGAYTDYPLGSYCRKKLLTKDIDGKFNCEGVYTDYPAGSYCWDDLQPDCEDDYDSYPVGSYCYNSEFPGQDPDMDNSYNCAINSGIGSLCWRESFGECELEAGDPPHATGSYCWRRERALENGYCEGGYSEFPKLSDCWVDARKYPNDFYYDPDSCSVKCQFNGTFVSCDIGTPDGDIPFEITTGTYIGQRVHADAFVSFKVRIKTINGLGQEKNNDTEVRLKINDVSP